MLFLKSELLGFSLLFLLLLLILEFLIRCCKSRLSILGNELQEVKRLELVNAQLKLGVQNKLGPGFDASEVVDNHVLLRAEVNTFLQQLLLRFEIVYICHQLIFKILEETVLKFEDLLDELLEFSAGLLSHAAAEALAD